MSVVASPGLSGGLGCVRLQPAESAMKDGEAGSFIPHARSAFVKLGAWRSCHVASRASSCPS